MNFSEVEKRIARVQKCAEICKENVGGDERYIGIDNIDVLIKEVIDAVDLLKNESKSLLNNYEKAKGIRDDLEIERGKAKLRQLQAKPVVSGSKGEAVAILAQQYGWSNKTAKVALCVLSGIEKAESSGNSVLASNLIKIMNRKIRTAYREAKKELLIVEEK